MRTTPLTMFLLDDVLRTQLSTFSTIARPARQQEKMESECARLGSHSRGPTAGIYGGPVVGIAVRVFLAYRGWLASMAISCISLAGVSFMFHSLCRDGMASGEPAQLPWSHGQTSSKRVVQGLIQDYYYDGGGYCWGSWHDKCAKHPSVITEN